MRRARTGRADSFGNGRGNGGGRRAHGRNEAAPDTLPELWRTLASRTPRVAPILDSNGHRNGIRLRRRRRVAGPFRGNPALRRDRS